MTPAATGPSTTTATPTTARRTTPSRPRWGDGDRGSPAAHDGPGTTARAQTLALDAYRVLGCYGFARVDLMLDEQTGEPTVLEANAIPGLTETSLLPQAAEAAGISFAAFVERVLDLALARTAAETNAS